VSSRGESDVLRALSGGEKEVRAGVAEKVDERDRWSGGEQESGGMASGR
jgi:hypothetical protein